MKVFAAACRDVIEILKSTVLDERGRELAHEASNLLTAFDIWQARPPPAADRAAAMARMVALQAHVDSYLLHVRVKVAKAEQRRSTPPPRPITFGFLLQYYRESHGIELEQVAAETGLPIARLRELEDGDNPRDEDELKRVVKAVERLR